MKTSEIKERMKNWNGKIRTEMVCSDPIRYQAAAEVTMYGETYVGYGDGETVAEAKNMALHSLASKAF